MKRSTVSVWGMICVSLLVSLLTTGPARAGEIELLSTAATESDTAGPSDWPNPSQTSLSPDGRWIAFSSVAANVVPGQRDHDFPSMDVFLHDRQDGTTVLVSHAPGRPETPADGLSEGMAVIASWEPSISADGRWIAYTSRSTGLIPGQQASQAIEPYAQVFLYDRDTGTNLLVSRSAGNPDRVSNSPAEQPRISADGAWIVFTSWATDLVDGQNDLNSNDIGFDAFLYERATGQITLASRAAGLATTTGDGFSKATSISADGRYVVLSSTAMNLVPGFTTALQGLSVFLFDRVTGTTTLVSRTSASATAGVHGEEGAVSADGSVVVFVSNGNDLVAGQADHNSLGDVFLFDRATGTNTLVSRSAAGATETGNLPAGYPQVSADGGLVAFISSATDATAGQIDTNQDGDVFLFRRATSSVSLVSRSAASPVTAANAGSPLFHLAADGSRIVFQSAATNLVAGQADANSGEDVFVFDPATGAASLVSGAGGSAQTTGNGVSGSAVVSADGDWIVFSTQASDLVSGTFGTFDLNRSSDTILHDRAAGTSEVLTIHPPDMASATPFGESVLLSASADGRYAVFLGTAENYVAGQTPGTRPQVYLVDRQTGTTTLVSHAASSPTTPGNGRTLTAAVSADGSSIAFVSDATDLVPGQNDSPESLDLFLYDRAAGTTTMVSRAAGSAATAGSPWCEASRPALSEDGRWLAFSCFSSNLVPGQNDAGAPDPDIFLFDRDSGQNLLVSRAAGSTVTGAGSWSSQPVISADGARIAYTSEAQNLIAGGEDTNGSTDVFLFDRTTGQALLASRAAGTAATAAEDGSHSPAIDRQGRHVAFTSSAVNLVSGVAKSKFTEDVFLFDANTGMVELISRSAASPTTPGDGSSRAPVISGDGLSVAFLSSSGNLVTGQTEQFASSGPTEDVFVHDRTSRITELVSRSAASATSAGSASSARPAFTPDGRYLAFVSAAGNLSPNGEEGGVFLYDRRLRSLERIAWLNPYAAGNERLLPLLSEDASVVFFTSNDSRLTGNDFNARDDVFAYVRSAPQGSDFFSVAPCRLETGATVASGSTLLLELHGACGVPLTATAVAVNVTVTQPTGTGRLTLHPGNLAAPLTSTLNFAAGRTLANNAILSLALNGEGSLAVTPFVNGNGTVRVILDVSGYFE